MAAITRTLTALALALRGCTAAPASNDTYHQVVLSQEEGAACLDGSPPSLYFRAGSGDGASKLLVYHEGGGWCESMEDCADRARGHYGSSAGDGATLADAQGYLSPDPEVNPMMYNWNSVYLRYCDGASFSGNNATLATVPGAAQQLHFKGAANRRAAFHWLLSNASLASMTDVVIAGSSAGALAVYLHLDDWCDGILRAAAAAGAAPSSPPAAVRCVGMPDSGFFLDYEAPNGGLAPPPAGRKELARSSDSTGSSRLATELLPQTTQPGNYRDGLRWAYQQQNASVHPDCRASHASDGAAWSCMFAEHAAPFVHTPLFALQSQYDQWQTDHVLATNTDAALINQMGANITARIFAGLIHPHPANGMFLDACHHHSWYWGNITIDGRVVAQAMAEWYAALPGRGGRSTRPAAASQPQRVWWQQEVYPCAACCANGP